jgi:hypothetical protein
MPKKRVYPTNLGTVRITLPASVASDINQLQSSLANIAEQLGCPKCVSGYNCRFQIEQAYLFDPIANSLNVAGATDSVAANPTVRVNLAPKTSYSITAIQSALRRIAELSGHSACATGCNMYFERFQDRLFNVSNAGRFNQLKYTASV